MKAVICGAGFVGEELANWLIKNKFDVSIIDNDKKLIESITDRINAKGIVGDAVSKDALVKAETEIADFLLVVTNSNATNILSGIEGKKLGAKRVIVKVNNYDNPADFEYFKNEYGIDFIIDSSEIAASKIIQLMFNPSMIKIIPFASNEICMLEHTVNENSKLLNTVLRDIPSKVKNHILIISLKRNNKYIIPKGNDEIMFGDTIYIICEPNNAATILEELEGTITDKPTDFVIMGGSKISYRTAKYFNDKKIPCRVYNDSLDRCNELMNELPNLEFIHFKTTDFTRKSIDVKKTTSVLCATGNDETNLFYTVGLNSLGAGNIIVHIDNESYANILSNVKAQTLITKDLVVLDEILKAVRLEMKNISSLIKHELLPDIYTYQLRVDDEKFKDIMIKDIKIKDDAMLGMILRKNEIIIPNGKTVIKADDELFVISTNTKIKNIKDAIEC